MYIYYSQILDTQHTGAGSETKEDRDTERCVYITLFCCRNIAKTVLEILGK